MVTYLKQAAWDEYEKAHLIGKTAAEIDAYEKVNGVVELETPKSIKKQPTALGTSSYTVEPMFGTVPQATTKKISYGVSPMTPVYVKPTSMVAKIGVFLGLALLVYYVVKKL